MDFVFSDHLRILDDEIEKLSGGRILAGRFLSLLETEDQLTVEEYLDTLEQSKIALDISDLPPQPLTGSSALRLKQEADFRDVESVTAGLDENDPLRLYFQELAATPAAGDVQLYADRYLTGEYHLAEQIVNLCLSRVVQTAFEYTGHGVLLLDLIQEGSMGLWQSIPLYSGGDFQLHADWWIRQYMARSVVLTARSSGIGQQLRQSLEDYMDADQYLLTQLGRNPIPEEIAEHLGITQEEAQRLEKMVNDARKFQRTPPEENKPEEAEEEDQAVENTAYFQLRQRIADLLANLTPEDVQLLTLRFGLEGGQPKTPVETGKLMNLTPAEVLQREAAALAKLRNQ